MLALKGVTFRSLHILHPESDFRTGRRFRLAGRALATEPTDKGWLVWGAKSVDITVALRTQCHRKVVSRKYACTITAGCGQGGVRGGVEAYVLEM